MGKKSKGGDYMSVSIHVVGIIEATDEYLLKLAAYKACQTAGVAISDELLEYFENSMNTPCEEGIEVPLEVIESDSADYCIYDVDLTKARKDLTKIRIYYG